MSPTEPAGNLLSLAPIPVQANMYKFFAPVLSAQFITDATGKELVILSLIPLRPPLPTAIEQSGLTLWSVASDPGRTASH